jgi:hypothetical protein
MIHHHDHLERFNLDVIAQTSFYWIYPKMTPNLIKNLQRQKNTKKLIEDKNVVGTVLLYSHCRLIEPNR